MLFRLSGIAVSLALTLAFCADPYAASAQGQPNVSVVNLQVQPGNNGTQMVLTPSGRLVMLPGAGVNGNVLQLYMGNNGGFWYLDRQGQTEDITAYVQQIRSQTAAQQGMQQATPPQYAPYPSYSTNQAYPSNQNNQNNQNNQSYPANESQSSSSSKGSSSGGGARTAVAAGVGAMVGSTVGNMAYYNNVPYGTPMYYNNNRPYYNDDRGKEIFVNDDGEVKWNNVAAANNIQNSRQQQKINQAKSYQTQRAATQAQSAPPQQQQQSQRRQFDQEQGQRFQQQQNWYQEQRKDSGRATAWQRQSAGENPFVRQSGRSGRQAGGNERSFGGGERAGGGRDFGGGGGRRGGGGGRRGR